MAAYLKLKGEDAPVGTWMPGFLVTDYFGVECRLREPVKWRVRRSRPAVLRNLRRRLLDAERRAGIDSQAAALRPRPLAGTVPYGPLPLPSLRETVKRPVTTKTFEPFDVPTDQKTRPGFDWQFRSGLRYRSPEPPSWVLWPTVGLLPPDRQEA